MPAAMEPSPLALALDSVLNLAMSVLIWADSFPDGLVVFDQLV